MAWAAGVHAKDQAMDYSIHFCRCRFCGGVYREADSRAKLNGYCSQNCVHLKAAELGFNKEMARKSGLTEFECLKQRDEVGSVFISAEEEERIVDRGDL